MIFRTIFTFFFGILIGIIAMAIIIGEDDDR